MTDKEIFLKFMQWMGMKKTGGTVFNNGSSLVLFSDEENSGGTEDFSTRGYDNFYSGGLFTDEGSLIKGYMDSHVMGQSEYSDQLTFLTSKEVEKVMKDNPKMILDFSGSLMFPSPAFLEYTIKNRLIPHLEGKGYEELHVDKHLPWIKDSEELTPIIPPNSRVFIQKTTTPRNISNHFQKVNKVIIKEGQSEITQVLNTYIPTNSPESSDVALSFVPEVRKIDLTMSEFTRFIR